MLFADNDRDSFTKSVEQVKAMQALSHTHLIRYLDVQTSRDPLKISVIMPFYSERDLSYLIKSRNAPFAEHDMSSIVLQIASALAYLHGFRPPLIHRDVKPDNVLMFDNGKRVLLMDLDTCRSDGATTTVVGTADYMAPETFRSMGSVKSDIWSLGVLTFAMAARPEFMTLPSNGSPMLLSAPDWQQDDLNRQIIAAVGANCRQYSRRFVRLLVKMLQHDPTKRPTALQVIEEISVAMEEQLIGQAIPMNFTSI
jgi:serine/threonine protein kinase